MASVAGYVRLLLAANRRVNLVSRRLSPEAVSGLAEGSYRLLDDCGVPAPSGLLDLGSGGGLAGIPLALRYPAAEIVLAESRKRRAAELERFVRTLRLANALVLSGRVEEYPSLQESFDVVIAFGVAPALRALPLALAFVVPGGTALVSIPADPGPDLRAQWEFAAQGAGAGKPEVVRGVLDGRRSVLKTVRVPGGG